MRHLVALSSTPLLFAVAACAASPSTTASGSPGHSPTPSPNDAGTTTTVNGQSVSIAEVSETRLPASSVSLSTLNGAVQANNAFAVDLYTQLRATSASSNLLTSPVSASLALTMTYAGAAGTTATQMASALHYGNAASSIFEGQNALSQALDSRGPAALAADDAVAQQGNQPAPASSDYQLQVVNSVWGQSTYAWNTPFLNILAQDYGTGVYLEDFITRFDPARILINDWVSNATADRINDLLPEGSLDDSTRMVLVNAIHLKLPWATAFDPSATAPATFTTATGSVSTPFMNSTAYFSYYEDADAQVVGLPLYNNQVTVVLAFPKGDLATYEASLTAASPALAMPTTSSYVQLSVPKVSFASPTFSMKAALRTMGMSVAFEKGAADFTGLSTVYGDSLFISDVLQKAMIAMQETGVEAAAATAVIVEGETLGMVPQTPPTPIPMIVNRPYVLSIVDVPTGTVLFLGHIADPTEPGGS